MVIALHGWMVRSDTLDGQSVPFYLQPSLGGPTTLRSFTDYRFRDDNMLVANACHHRLSARPPQTGR